MAVVLRRKTNGVGDEYVVEERIITVAEDTAQALTLAFTPNDPTKVLVSSPNGPDQRNGFDYEVVGSTLNWNGKALETLLEAGDILIVNYFI